MLSGNNSKYNTAIYESVKESCERHRRSIIIAKAILSLATVCTMAAALWLTPIRAFAGGFDPVYYAERYPDVANAVGTSQKALINHYLTFGIAEGRFQNAAEEEAGTPLNTYIDIDLENQNVVYILDGTPVFETPCVSGDVSKGRQTPTGTFAIYGHIPGQYLTGPTWKNWVDYWMPFSPGGCGIHDATWRRKFGGTIYKNNGSHGCVNISHDAAKTLFDMVDIGTVVIVH
ncbi:MAG: L,D-transpeptidase [Butyrivibrio sp.]|nr:L,D-transpeptidase [Butyrivibrio sp.]